MSLHPKRSSGIAVDHKTVAVLLTVIEQLVETYENVRLEDK